MSRVGGTEGGERRRGRGRGAEMAAAGAGLNEPSHSPAALTVEAGALVATVLSEPVTRSGGAVFIRIGQEVPPSPGRCLRHSGEGDVLRVWNNRCGQDTR